MRGTVVAVDRRGGVVAVQTMHGQFTILRPLNGAAMDKGDAVSGPLETPGRIVLSNGTSGLSVEADVVDVHLTRATARERIKF